VRRGDKVAMAATAQVTLRQRGGEVHGAQGAAHPHDRILAGFRGREPRTPSRSSSRFEAKLEKHQGTCCARRLELAKDWRTDRMLRRLEAMLAIADRETSLIITGNGDVLEPEHGCSPSAAAAATRKRRRWRCSTTRSCARGNREKSLEIASEICIYTNKNT